MIRIKDDIFTTATSVSVTYILGSKVEEAVLLLHVNVLRKIPFVGKPIG